MAPRPLLVCDALLLAGLYVARGSGLWYDPGRSMVMSDVVDLARHFNYSLWDKVALAYDTEFTGPRIDKPSLMKLAATALWKQGFDTLRFTHHVDAERQDWRYKTKCTHAFFKDELFSLRPRPPQAVCPPSDAKEWAFGWNASRPGCTCVRTKLLITDRDRQLMRERHPFWHVECSRNGTLCPPREEFAAGATGEKVF